MQGGLTCGGGESLRSLCGQFAGEVLVDGNLQAHRAVGTAYAKRAGQRRRLLGGFELDHACDARRAAIVDKAKRMNRAVRLADRQDVLGQRVEVAHSAEPLDYFRLHLRLMLGLGHSPGYPKSRDTFVVRRLQDEADARSR